jgi:hypothetical protein
MKKSHSLIPVFSILIIIMVGPTTAYAQGESTRTPNNQYPGPTRSRDTIRQPSIREREFALRQLERDAAARPVSEETKLTVTQIANDYRRIQIVNNGLMSSTIPVATPDYAKIADATGEIRTLANRLKDNLRLSKVGKETENGKHRPASNVDEVKTDLLSLDKLVMSFVENPIFKRPEVLNVDDAAKARSDVEAIIELTSSIRKDAERLKKSLNTKPQ